MTSNLSRAQKESSIQRRNSYNSPDTSRVQEYGNVPGLVNQSEGIGYGGAVLQSMQMKEIDFSYGLNQRPIQQKEEEDPLQKKEDKGGAGFSQGNSAKNSGGLPEGLKSGIESLSGMSMDDVQVHYNSQKPANVNALAYAQGTNIHLGAGQEKHLPHEAWHVVQQKQGRVKPTMQMKGAVNINDDEGLEKEADEMGEKAMQRKATDGGNKVSQSSSAINVMQRRIGFEIETGIPITERVPNTDPLTVGIHPHKYEDAHPQTMAQNVKQGTLTISADHSGGHAQTVLEPFDQWSIIEAVTDPIDDSMSLNQFDAIATVWLSRIISIKQQAQQSPPAQQLLGSDYYVGLPSAQNYTRWDRIAPQVTVGVPLDQAAKLISSFRFLGGPRREHIATELAKEAPAKALKVMQGLIGAIPPSSQNGVPELKGLITLMMNYLTAGNDDNIAKVIYMKNRPSNVFYKSKLSDVRDNLLSTNYGDLILNDANNRAALRTLLLIESGRTSGDPLFKADPSPINPQGAASTVTVHQWITEVLSGVDDRIFDEMKNPWANSIAPDANDEVVIELRKLGYDLTHSNYTLEDFNGGLLQYMKKVYLANKQLKNHEV
jgi:hypothetical protein